MVGYMRVYVCPYDLPKKKKHPYLKKNPTSFSEIRFNKSKTKLTTTC